MLQNPVQPQIIGLRHLSHNLPAFDNAVTAVALKKSNILSCGTSPVQHVLPLRLVWKFTACFLFGDYNTS